MIKVHISASFVLPIIPYILPVPIYDARGQDAFGFTAEDIAQYRRLPLYTDSTTNEAVDLPADTLATVSYAVNCYKYNGANCANRANAGKMAISFNILCVIALGDIDQQLMAEISDRM